MKSLSRNLALIGTINVSILREAFSRMHRGPLIPLVIAVTFLQTTEVSSTPSDCPENGKTVATIALGAQTAP
jgi:hypothetical protein